MNGRRRLTFQTVANKRERKARANAKLAHEHLMALSEAMELHMQGSDEYRIKTVEEIIDGVRRRMN